MTYTVHVILRSLAGEYGISFHILPSQDLIFICIRLSELPFQLMDIGPAVGTSSRV